MQIHEITKTKIDEGVGSFLGNVAGKVSAGAKNLGQKFSPKSDFKSAYANQMKAQQVAMLGKKVAQVWNNYAQQLKATTPDPARYATLYQQALTAFVQKNLLKGQAISTAINKQEINQAITDIASAKDNPQQVASLMNKLVQQASVSQQDPSISTTGSLVKIISTNPTVIQYRNVDYAQNANGDWANQKTQRVPDESFQAFLDTEARKAGA